MNPRMRSIIVPLVATLSLGLVACSNGDEDNGGAAGSNGANAGAVGVTEKDFAIALDTTSVSAGSVTFDIKNEGPSTHEFVVFQTDLDPDALPTKKDENGIPIVDEEGKGLTAIDEVEDINAGSSATLTVNLDAGQYVAICNLPGHYQQGMLIGFTVT